MNDELDLHLLSQVSDCRSALRVGINDKDDSDTMATFLLIQAEGLLYYVKATLPGEPAPQVIAAALDDFADALQLAELVLGRWWPPSDFEEAWAGLKPALESWGRETKGN